MNKKAEKAMKDFMQLILQIDEAGNKRYAEDPRSLKMIQYKKQNNIGEL